MDSILDKKINESEIDEDILSSQDSYKPQLYTPHPPKPQFCGKCDNGYVTVDGKKVECLCQLKAKAQTYLTPTYVNAKYLRDLNVTPFLGKNILLDTVPQEQFKSLFKSFILNTGMKFKHMTVTGYDCLQAYLTNTEAHIFDQYVHIDLLVLYLAYDPRCNSYGTIFTTLLEKRSLVKRPTWIYSNTSINSNIFLEKYGDKLVNYCRENFIQVNPNPQPSTKPSRSPKISSK